MKTDNSTLFKLFDIQQRYIVPLFQRSYVWTKNEWDSLWSDIFYKADEIMCNSDIDASEEEIKDVGNHFLGAIVLKRLKTTTLQIPCTQIIDGQQRLTTLQILLAVLRDISLEIGENNLTTNLDRLTINNGATDENEEFKVWPSNLDRTDFKNTINARSFDSLKNKYPSKTGHRIQHRSNIIDCYIYFTNVIRQFCTTLESGNPFNIETQDFGKISLDRFTSIYQAIRNNLELVVIDLEDNDDPQIIFETLNARGMSLQPSDLIRNFVFMCADRDQMDIDELYSKTWSIFDDGETSENTNNKK